MVEQPALSFAGLLRRLRDDARLTQEELAEAAGVSPRTVSDLERGINRTAHKDTAVLLAGALGLDERARELFILAARGRAAAGDVLATTEGTRPGVFAAATQALPRDTAAFTGRRAELAQLMETLAGMAADGGVVGIHAIDGMAGIGKTTFAVHAAHRLAGMFPDGQFFLPLHAHTAGQRPVDPADALASLLLSAGVAAGQIPPGLEARAARWRDHVAGKKILLVLDDAAGHEQVRPLLPGTPGSLVLITSRRRLAALQDAAVISLDILPPGEAAALLARLAARPGISAADPAVGEITRLCGYLPLAIGMLASQLRHHPAWTAAGLAAELSAARQRLELMHAENVSAAAAFDLSYQELTPGQRRLFLRLGLIPGADFDARAAAALEDIGLEAARRCLDQLYDQHLITEPAPGRYQLHDLLREHARTLAAASDPADSAAAAGRLLDYYLHTALAAGAHIASTYLHTGSLPPAKPPQCAPPLSTPGQAAAWLEAERANLHAAAGYAAAHELPSYAILIPAAMASFLDTRGHWDQAVALYQTALAAARQAGDRPGQAHALMLLWGMHAMAGDSTAAATAAGQALELFRDLGDRTGQSDAINRLGYLHGRAGDYPAAVTCHHQALDLFRDLGDRRGQAEALHSLSGVYWHTADYPAARACAEQALELFRDLGHRHGQADALSELGTIQKLTDDYPAAAASHRQALQLYRDLGDRFGQALALNQIGSLQRLAGDYPAAAASLQQALDLFRDLGVRDFQGWALSELGRLQQLTGDYPAAAASHQEALRQFRDADHRWGQASVLNDLGKLASQTAATGQARDHHNQALAIATAIGAPLQEARALEGIGHSHLQDGNPGQAVAHLRRALTIYQRIGSPRARRVEEILRRHQLEAAALRLAGD
jgi:tetratricopeptide (TPR) repeat protein/transcriptional regulator with XRE-family HTH domain